jgi:hypothetical protein
VSTEPGAAQLLLFAPRAEATVLEFDFSGVSVNPLTGNLGPNPLGYTATASFTLDSSAFNNPYITSVGPTGIREDIILTSALTSFSATLTTPLGNRQFSLSDVNTGCFSVLGDIHCWDMDFEISPSGQIVFGTGYDGFTYSGNPLGFVNPYFGGLTFHGGPVRVDYSGTWTTAQNGGVAAPLSDVGTGLPSLLLVGGLILWGRRRQLRTHATVTA